MDNSNISRLLDIFGQKRAIPPPRLILSDGLTRSSDSSKSLKIALIGTETGVGKSWLVQRMAGEMPSGNLPTIGARYYQRKVLIDGSKIELNMWDITGDRLFESARVMYYRDANCFVIVFDLTLKSSFYDTPLLLKEIKKHGYEDVPKILLGNKSDRQDDRTVSQQEIEEFIKKEKIPYFEVSAKTGENVEKALARVIEIAINNAFSLLSKIVLVGRSLTGKTSLAQGTLKIDGSPTLPKSVKVEGLEVELGLRDTPGKWEDRSAIANCYKGAQGVIIVFDLTDHSSFDDAKVWLDHIKDNVQDKRCCKMILGNKSDLQGKRVISDKKIQELIGKERIPYFDVSAKTGENVEEAFADIARQIQQTYGPFKIAFIGSGSTGKTSLINKLSGSNHKVKSVRIENSLLKFQLVDTVGQEEYQGNYDYKNVLGVAIVFDLTKPHSIDDIKRWLKEIKKKHGEKVCRIIIGNKMDLEKERVIDKQMVRELIKEVKIPYFEVSAKTGENVEKAFFNIARGTIKSSLSSQIVVIGDSLSGKSCLISRLAEDKFLSDSSPTHSLEYMQTRFVVDNSELNFEVWDIPDQEEFRKVAKNDASIFGAAIVFDLTKQHSFDNIQKWLEEIKKQHVEKVCQIIIGTKRDLTEERVIDKQTIIRLIKEVKIPYFEVSAKTGENVKEAFSYLARDIKRNSLANEEKQKDNDNINTNGASVSECNLF